MADPSFGLVILDEINIALRYDYLDHDTVIAALKARRPDLHVVVTGRNAKPTLIQGGGSRHRDDAREASFRRRREGASWH